ncbi:MAG: NAD(P)/FAD-dependent oxidoreductase, partial [Candidatus Nanopelagicales bacterium]
MNNSYWWKSLPLWQPLPPLAESIDVDIAIVGAGYTGLWSAYFLHKAQPNLQIAIIEAEHVGFGASGRNGGWVSSFWPTPIKSIAKKHGPEIAIDFQRYLH